MNIELIKQELRVIKLEPGATYVIQASGLTFQHQEELRKIYKEQGINVIFMERDVDLIELEPGTKYLLKLPKDAYMPSVEHMTKHLNRIGITAVMIHNDIQIEVIE